MEVEEVGDVRREIRNGLVLRFQQNPALIQPLRCLWFGEDVAVIFENHTDSYSVHSQSVHHAAADSETVRDNTEVISHNPRKEMLLGLTFTPL